MPKFIVLLIIVFFIILSLLAFFNKGAVDLTVWNGVTFENIPVIAVILVSTSIGIFAMLIIIAIRDAKRYVHSWQLQRDQKKELKIQELYAKGLDAFHADRTEEAAELFNRVTESDPSHVGALLRAGDILFERGEMVKARESYMRAHEIRPGNIEVLLSLERVDHDRQKWQEALKHIDSILGIDEGNLKALRMKRDIQEKNGQWEEVIETQNKILKTNLSPEEEQKEQQNLQGYRYESANHYLQSGVLDKAIKKLKSIIKADKDFIVAYVSLTGAYEKEANYKDAEETLRKGYEETSALVFLAWLEDFYITRGEPGKIIDLYQKIIQEQPMDYRLQFFLAKLYYRLEMIDYAFNTVNAIEMTAFDSPDLHTLLACIYSRRSDYESASDEFKKALKIEKAFIIPFCCSHCGYKSRKWSGRCPDCSNWNSLTLDIHEVCNIRKRQSRS
jgi:tetratricopeptide (TPR) repeat protein